MNIPIPTIISTHHLILTFKSKPVLRFSISRKKISKKKNYFNSGQIQVDHDDTEEEFEKKKEAIDYLENNKELIINTIRQNQILTNIKPEETTTKIDNDNNNIVNIGTVTQIINPKGTQNEIDLNQSQ